MRDELKRSIEEFIINYENQINDIDNMDLATTDMFLEHAINLLSECVTTSEELT